jgi:hypothetical protein
MIPLYSRLQTLWRKNLRGTKVKGDCGEGGEELEQAQSKTLDYNSNYRFSDGRRHRVRKFLPRILAPLYYRLKTAWKKNWLARTAMAGAITLGVALILGIVAGSILRSDSATASTGSSQSTGKRQSTGNLHNHSKKSERIISHF